MRVIIAGGRDLLPTVEQVEAAVRASGFAVTEVVSGACRGVDVAGERWARTEALDLRTFPAQWRRDDGSVDYSAGPKRNGVMAEYADALIAFWDGASSGTGDMVRKMQSLGKPVFVASVEGVAREKRRVR